MKVEVIYRDHRNPDETAKVRILARNACPAWLQLHCKNAMFFSRKGQGTYRKSSNLPPVNASVTEFSLLLSETFKAEILKPMQTDPEILGPIYLETVIHNFRTYKTLGDKTLGQLKPDEWHKTLSPESNSAAILVQHLAGNMQSRFTDFLTSDGEKPTRNRDAEFETQALTGAELLTLWENGWQTVLKTVENLSPADLTKTVTIRTEKQSVIAALNRQVAHYAYHVGKLVLLVKTFRDADWQQLSIAKGSSQTYNQQVAAAQ
jgi:hypothetical protein